MKNKLLYLSVCVLMLPLTLRAQQNKDEILKESRQVIERFAGKKLPLNLSLSLAKENGCDVYQTSVQNGKLTVQASSGVALCHGFYDYLKSHGLGICSWSGNRCDWPDSLPDQAPQKTVSPYKHHFYFNVVTFGYTMPYWTWQRWQKEIDWMALHGIDMPLALVGQEAISRKVWKQEGLTDKDIADYMTGPAHLPWMRMGNISHIDTLYTSWYQDQVDLQHHILGQMRRLGMTPVSPGFSGFVPQAFKRLYPNLKLIQTSWSNGTFHNWMIATTDPLFSKLQKLFIQSWEKEFGKSKYFLVDSFNEMDIPFPAKGTPERYKQLAEYGQIIYNSIRSADPDAAWALQGWMFGYQRNIWDYQTLQALVSKVPDQKMLLLDMSEDYNYDWWGKSNWDYYKGFFNKKWIYSVIPNMGGKTGMTGRLDFYANGALRALRSGYKGNLFGYGASPEGVENNEVVYELICDAGWKHTEIDVNHWLENYSLCRYGQLIPGMIDCWKNLRKSVYGSFTPHPRYNWQFRPGLVDRGSINANKYFFRAIEEFAETANWEDSSPLFLVDLSEMTAQYLGAKIEILAQAINQSYLYGDATKAARLEARFTRLARGMDSVLSIHPTLNLDRWIAYARSHGNTTVEKDAYERNARRIVTIWGPPVDDYSARIWSGLIRDYYLPRWKHYFESKAEGKPFDFAKWEKDWVENKKGTSPLSPCKDLKATCMRLIHEAGDISSDQLIANAKDQQPIGSWSPQNTTGSWQETSWTISPDQVRNIDGVLFAYQRGKSGLQIRNVSLWMDGKKIAVNPQQGFAGQRNENNYFKLSVPPDAKGNNSCQIRATVKKETVGDSFGQIILKTQSNRR